MEYTSEGFKLVLDDEGVMTIWPAQPPTIQRTIVSAEGVKVEDVQDEGLKHHFAATPAHKIAYAGDGQWHVDTEAGMSRWIGMQSSRQVGRALRVLGFRDHGRIMAQARKHEHEYMGRACR